MRLALLILGLLATSCSRSTLDVNTGYFTRSDLASVKIGTPDPTKQEAIFGQRVYISWNATKKEMESGPLALHIQVLLKKGKRLDEKVPLDKPSGTYIFPIVGTNYTQEGGLLSYQVTLLAGTKTVAESHHKFWVKQIEFSE